MLFYLMEQHTKCLLRTLQVLYICTLCDSININTIIDNHRWHATNSLERTRSLCWCLYNHKGCIYRASVRSLTKTWRVVLLNKKKHVLLSQVYCVWQVVKTPTIISNNPVQVKPRQPVEWQALGRSDDKHERSVRRAGLSVENQNLPSDIGRI